MSMDERDVEATIDLVHQAALSGVDADRKEDDWREHPLFRTDLPADIENDRYLGAFQHVMYENETPDSLAKHFKELGNEFFRAGKANWLNAAAWWTRGLEENPTDNTLRSILHSNRATVSLGLGQYQKAALDADWAIKHDKFNKKAYVRAAHAYQGMSDWDKSLAAARAGLEIIAADDPLAKQLSEVVENVSKQINSNRNRVSSFFASLAACNSFFKKTGYAIGQFDNNWQSNWDLILQFDEDRDETIWPMAICFNEVLQVDFVEAISEGYKLLNIMSMVLPGISEEATAPNWDTEGRYTTDSMLLYFQMNEVPQKWGRSMKQGEPYNIAVDPNACLRDVFKQKDYIVPGYPVLCIAAKGSKFLDGLGIKEVIKPGGARRKLTEDDTRPPAPKPGYYDKYIEAAKREEEEKKRKREEEDVDILLPVTKPKSVEGEAAAEIAAGPEDK